MIMNDATTLKLRTLDLSQAAYETRYPVLRNMSYESWVKNQQESWEMARAILTGWSGREILEVILTEE